MTGLESRTLPADNILPRRLRRGINVGLAVILMLAAVAPPAWAADAPASRPIDAPRVDWSNAQQVFHMVEQWVREGTPTKPMDGEPILVSDLAGVEVTVRWLGWRMGTGQATFESFTPTAAGTLDLTSLARSATLEAMLGVDEKLRAARQRAHAATTQNAAAAGSAPMTMAELGPLLLVDVQIAHRLAPVHLPPGAPEDQVYLSFAPGFHGLRLSAPPGSDRVQTSWLWPADALAADVAPPNQVRELLGGMGLKLDQLNKIARPGGPGLDRFEVIHMVRPSPNEPLTQLVRGNVLLPPTSLDQATLDAMSLRMADHLMHGQHEDGTFAGSYDPTMDRYDPLTAEEPDAALATYALARWAEPEQGQDPTERMLAGQMAVRRSVDALLKSLLDKDRKPDLTGQSLVLLTLVDSAQFTDRKVARDALGRRLLSLRNPDGMFRADDDPKSSQANMPTQTLAAAALARLYCQNRDAELGTAVQATLDKIWQTTEPIKSVASLSWLLQADAAFESVAADGQGGARRQQHARQLQKLLPVIDLLLSRQITRPPLVGPPDVVGGFELQEPNPELPPNPDWRTAHILAFLAQAIRTSDLTVGRNRVDGLLSCGLAARFLAQLMFDDPSCYYIRTPGEVVGGVRTILWDNRLTPAPTAMALLASVELRRTLLIWAKQRNHIEP